MQNRLLADIGNGLAKKPFEKVSWWWRLSWGNFINIYPSLTVDNPLWNREESNLKSVRLFGLYPNELRTEILYYWQQPFWKRWLLSLFTPIQRKIKLWSYYHRCMSFREVCIKNLFGVEKPITFLEQYLERNITDRLQQSRIQFENYLEKNAGNFRTQNNLGVSRSIFLQKNWKFFSKLMEKKLSQFPIEDKDSIQSQLEEEYDRLEMILHQYLSIWCDSIFNPSISDEPLNRDIFVDATIEKEISYSIHSIKDWIKIKRQVIESMLQEESPNNLSS